MWGVGANCYAYACNEDHPVNGLRGAAVPGGYADRGVFVRQGDTAETYANRLIEGVFLDAGRNKVDAKVSTDINTLADGGSGYIIAMVANLFGFHFFRRDRMTHLWSWKDGIGEDRADQVNHVPSGQATTVNDALFIRMVHTNKAEYGPNWQAMTFRAYFGLGNINGMKVSGISHALDVAGGVFG
jgi:hypothetical protein